MKEKNLFRFVVDNDSLSPLRHDLRRVLDRAALLMEPQSRITVSADLNSDVVTIVLRSGTRSDNFSAAEIALRADGEVSEDAVIVRPGRLSIQAVITKDGIQTTFSVDACSQKSFGVLPLKNIILDWAASAIEKGGPQ